MLRFHHIIPLLLSLWLVFPVSAQTDYWQAAPGPYGGTTVRDLEIVPDGRVFAATTSGVFVSLDDGRSWEDISMGLGSVDIRDLHYRADGSLWAATFGAGLFMLNPSSDIWQAAALARVFTTSIIEPTPGLLLAGSNAFVYVSRDGGASWTAKSLDGFQVSVRALAFNETHLFAASSLGIFRSSDAGESWQFASFGLQELDVLSIATDADGNVYAGVNPANGGCVLYRSRGNANIWTCIQPQTDPIIVPVIKVAPDGTLFAGGFRYVLKSENEGDTWITYSASNSSVESMAFTGSSFLIGTQGLGVLRSDTGGSIWEDSNLGLHSTIELVTIDQSGRVLTGTEGGLFESRDYAGTWSRIEPGNPLVQRVTDVEIDAEGRIIAATRAGIWRQIPGSGWEALGPPGMPAIRDIIIQDDGTILAAYYEGIYSLVGSTWISSPIKGADQAARDVSAILQTADGTILAGASWDSWRKVAGSASWELMSAGSVPWFDAQTFARDENRIMAGTRFMGVLQSLNNGRTWQSVGLGLNGNEDVQHIAFDRGGRAHIATYGSGIFQLNSWTSVWVPMNRGLGGHHRVTSLAFDAVGNSYASTLEGGLFRHVVSSVVATEESAQVPSSFEVGAAYPNPATGIIYIPVSLRNASNLDVEVFDILGRRVLSNRSPARGRAPGIALDVAALPRGIYLYRISVGAETRTGSFTLVR